jgi:hypothetical protein
MYDYILITIGQDKSRNKLIRQDQVSNYYSKDDEDVLVSLFSYDETAIQYFQKQGTLRSYRDNMAINYFPFDIDNENFEQSCMMTKQLLNDLKNKGIFSYRISFSGKKGHHIIIPSSLFGGFKPSNVLPSQLLSLAKSLTTVQFDKSLYGNLRMFRLYGTKHPRSKLYKTQIEESLLDHPEQILELAKEYREPFSIPSQETVQSLVRLKERCFELVPEDSLIKLNYKPKNKLCMAKIMQGVGEGERHEALCRVTSHLRTLGMEPDVAWGATVEWLKKNKPSVIDDAAFQSFKSIWEGEYTYGCYDWLLDTYCDKECYIYSQKAEKTVQQEQQGVIFFSLVDAQKEYDKFIREDKRIRLGVSEQIDKIIKGIAPQQAGVILGRPTSFKSTVAMHMGEYFVNNYPGYFLYISLEMSLAMMYERQMQISTGKNSDFIEENYKDLSINENMRRFLISDKVDVSVKDIERAVLDFQEQKGEKIELIVIDFLHALKTGKATDTRSKMDEVIKELTSFPRKLDTRLIYLAHVSRGMKGKDDSVYLPVKLGDGKDTSSIENNAFFVFGTHLIRDDENCVVLQLLKNKNGAPLPTGVRLYKQNNSIQLKEKVDYLPFDEEKTPF